MPTLDTMSIPTPAVTRTEPERHAAGLARNASAGTRKARSTTRTSPAVIRELVRTFLPAYPRLYTSGELVLDDVSGFIAGRIDALPRLHRWPCRVALAAFQWSAFLRQGRPFTWLSPLQQRAQVDRWERSQMGSRRYLIRLIRNLTLLAFYEHPIVLNWLGIHRDRRRYERIESRQRLIAVQFDQRLESLRE